MEKLNQSKPKRSGKPPVGVTKKKLSGPSPDITADQFSKRMTAYASAEERRKIESYFKSGKGQYSEGDIFIGVRMGQVFALAKEFIDMRLSEIEKLLESPWRKVSMIHMIVSMSF
jgi:hypothetical protein